MRARTGPHTSAQPVPACSRKTAGLCCGCRLGHVLRDTEGPFWHIKIRAQKPIAGIAIYEATLSLYEPHLVGHSGASCRKGADVCSSRSRNHPMQPAASNKNVAARISANAANSPVSQPHPYHAMPALPHSAGPWPSLPSSPLPVIKRSISPQPRSLSSLKQLG